MAEVWIVALSEEHVEVYREPHAGTYEVTARVGVGGSVSPQALPDLSLEVAGILGKRSE